MPKSFRSIPQSTTFPPALTRTTSVALSRVMPQFNDHVAATIAPAHSNRLRRISPPCEFPRHHLRTRSRLQSGGDLDVAARRREDSKRGITQHEVVDPFTEQAGALVGLGLGRFERRVVLELCVLLEEIDIRRVEYEDIDR